MWARRFSGRLPGSAALWLSVFIAGMCRCPSSPVTPLAPAAPAGPDTVQAGSWAVFGSSARHSLGHYLALRFDWGDGDTSAWTSFSAPGTVCSDSHRWSSPGEFKVRAQAADQMWVTSEWSDPAKVVVIRLRCEVASSEPDTAWLRLRDTR